MGLTPGENTVTPFLVNNTVQSASHMGLTPTRVLVKDGMVYPVVLKSATNCRIGSKAVADDLSICLLPAPTLLCKALVLVGPCGDYGEM